MARIFCLAIGYLLGCFQSAYFIGRWIRKIDIREYGSGNAGMTNVLRVMGTKWGMITLLLDLLKAVLAMIICGMVFGFEEKYLMLWAGLGCVLGHNFPFPIDFRGGKGVAVTMGVMLTFDWRIFVLAGLPAILLLLLTKYMSLASLTFMLLSLVFTIVFYVGESNAMEIILLSLILTMSGFVMHRDNIIRLLHGTERKVGHPEKPKKTDDSPKQTLENSQERE